jgi:RHH-type proline utilization regulon transcriptional repressor/proline dehydrogenase/delta 1-pyrroline-5-carboxylate dehydrogenase
MLYARVAPAQNSGHDRRMTAGIDQRDVPAFHAPYAPPDEQIAAALLAQESRDTAGDRRIDALATRLIEAIRARSSGIGGVEDFLHAYSLSTREGLALMVLAEALLRVPDTPTADRLIEDKLAGGDWSHPHSPALLVTASAWTLGLAVRIIQPGETPESVLDSLVKRLGAPAVRGATRQAMRLLGSHFVLGQTIEEALGRAAAYRDERFSFDMLGEGARTAGMADDYFRAYDNAIAAIGRAEATRERSAGAGISVKLSALHPRYEAVSGARVLAELVPRLEALAGHARDLGLSLTIDAEECDRLELSLEVIGALLANPVFDGWGGFGLALQAYSKRALAVIDWAHASARSLDRRLLIRLVKGAYWDTEIKRAQERGLADYPVFTRKPMTDLCYMACARKLLAARPDLYPQIATHNALTVASVIEDAGGVEGYEFQRLHGMGEVLYAALREEWPKATIRVYAPVGSHDDLLAYLVRRLLENGANSSFVSVAADPTVPIERLLRRPRSLIGSPQAARHPDIPLPRDLYAPARRNSSGVEFGDRASLEKLLADVRQGLPRRAEAFPLIDGIPRYGRERIVHSPIDGAAIGRVTDGDAAVARGAMDAAQTGFLRWSRTPVHERAAALDQAATLIEQQRGGLIALLQIEAGKTLDDAAAEVREAVDYCRYYAAQARLSLVSRPMPGPTGESNLLRYRGRGVFVCISPWNFPLAIFVGQIVAALVAGNAVVAKPAEQTPLIAYEVVRLLHVTDAMVHALHLVPGDGGVGAALVADPRAAGVAFTGSTEVAQAINRSLAARDGPIVPLIAETGGINPMIVDGTALPEQVTDDVLASAFRSAGQRCSALRLLCLPDPIAATMLELIAGAAATLRVGDPRDPATHVGPVIDAEAHARLMAWIEAMEAQGRVRFRWDRQAALPASGFYVPPTIVMLDRARDLAEEVFGPILHVVRCGALELATAVNDIISNGTALTLGIQSRIDATANLIAAEVPHGNVYVNRNMIGAVVGTQPFGGTALSGTGPKAGGPNYLMRFAVEQVVTVNTAAAGGNASLLMGEDASRAGEQ